MGRARCVDAQRCPHRRARPARTGGDLATDPTARWPRSVAGKRQGNRIIADATKIAQQSIDGRSHINSELLVGATVATLIDLSKGAEMIVVGCRGRGALQQRLLGSVSAGLVHHAYCPVAVIHDEDPSMPHPAKAPVLVGIDGSPASELATGIAFDQASRRGVELVALHAWSDAGVYEFPGTDWSTFKSLEDQLLAERVAGWQERYPDVTVRRVVVSDRPAWRLSRSLSLRNSWSSAVTAAAGSPECCWARSARRWCSQRVCR